MHVKAPTAAAIRSMCDLGAPQTQLDVIDCMGVDFEEGGKPEYPEKNPRSRVEIG